MTEPREFNGLAAKIVEAPTKSALWKILLGPIRDIFDYDSLVLVPEGPFPAIAREHFLTFGVDAAYMDEYFRIMDKDPGRPLIETCWRNGRSDVFTAEDIEPEDLANVDIAFDQLWGARSLSYPLVLVMALSGHRQALISMRRRRGRGHYSSRDKQAAWRLLPFLRISLDRLALLRRVSALSHRSGPVDPPDQADLGTQKPDHPRGNGQIFSIHDTLTERRMVELNLTRREIEISMAALRGQTNQQIASMFSISPATVAKHMQHICAKLGIHNRSQLWSRLGRPVSHAQLNAFDLTQREREVVEWVAAGLTTPRIAETLRISNATVANHLKSAFRKAGVSSRSELLARLLAFTPDR